MPHRHTGKKSVSEDFRKVANRNQSDPQAHVSGSIFDIPKGHHGRFLSPGSFRSRCKAQWRGIFTEQTSNFTPVTHLCNRGEQPVNHLPTACLLEKAMRQPESGQEVEEKV